MTFASKALGVGVHSLTGLALGVAVNKANKQFEDNWPRVYSKPLLAFALKLALVALVALLVSVVAPSFADEWQVTVPGLFFVSMYFGVQTSMMEDAGAL